VAKTTVPIGIIAGLLPGVTRTFATFQASGAQQASNEALAIYSGYDPQTRQFSVANMSFGLLPLIAGLVLHRVVGGMLGVNRTLAQSKVPLLRI